MAPSVRSTRRGGAKKAKRTLSSGQVHIFASFNNTIITVTDLQGNTVAWGSSGSAGFKGSRKSTPFAARLAAEQAIKQPNLWEFRKLSCSSKVPDRDAKTRFVQCRLQVSKFAQFRILPRFPTMVVALQRNVGCN
jgi:small subunit ribosomal protein S11